jgi:hypothetical protein
MLHEDAYVVVFEDGYWIELLYWPLPRIEMSISSRKWVAL